MGLPNVGVAETMVDPSEARLDQISQSLYPASFFGDRLFYVSIGPFGKYIHWSFWDLPWSIFFGDRPLVLLAILCIHCSFSQF